MDIQELETYFRQDDWKSKPLKVEVFAEKWYLGLLEYQANSDDFLMHFSKVHPSSHELQEENSHFPSSTSLIASLRGHAYRFDLAQFRNCW